MTIAMLAVPAPVSAQVDVGTVYYRNYPEIWAVDGDGSNPRPTGLPDEGRAFAWSPDGTRIAYTYDGPSGYDLWVMDADGSSPQQITSHTGDDVGPAWSPDGTTLAFSSFRARHWRIYTVAADGTSPAERVTGPASLAGTQVHDPGTPDWSPDGQRIVFTRMRARADRRILSVRTVDAGGGNPGLVARGASSPAWSPVADELAVIVRRDGISVFSSDGATRRDLDLSTQYARSQLTWSPDGGQLAFVNYHDDSSYTPVPILVVSVHGTDTGGLLVSDSSELFDWVA